MSSKYLSQRGKETLSRQGKVSTVSERGAGYRDKKGELYILNGIAMNRNWGKGKLHTCAGCAVLRENIVNSIDG